MISNKNYINLVKEVFDTPNGKRLLREWTVRHIYNNQVGPDQFSTAMLLGKKDFVSELSLDVLGSDGIEVLDIKEFNLFE